MAPAKECIRIFPLDLPGEVRREETKNPESFGVYENCQCLYVCLRKEIAAFFGLAMTVLGYWG